MKTGTLFLGFAAAGCVTALALQTQAQNVSQEDFNALKNTVSNLVQEVQKLEQTHATDEQAHQKDLEQIQQLRQQLGQTQQTALDAQQKAVAAANAAPANPTLPGPIDEATVNHNFIIVGDAEAQFGKTSGQHGSFELADFAPIFLYRASDDVLFEAGFDIMEANNTRPPGGSSTSLSLTFATMDYLLNDYMTLEAGQMLLPLGTYSERNAGWLNKIPDDPLVRDDLLPETGAGVQLRGAVPLKESGQSITYAVYAVNGPSSATGTATSTGDLDLAGNVGNNNPNWHANPSAGGRVGWFYPWKPHYDFELGLSGQTGEWSDSGNRRWSAGVVDVALHLGANIEVKGEYVSTWVETDDLGTIRPNGWWVQAGYKLAGLNLDVPFISNVELVSRYDCENDDGLTTAAAAGGPSNFKTDRYTAGFVYYFSNTLLFEADYEWLVSHGLATLPPNRFILQLSYGF